VGTPTTTIFHCHCVQPLKDLQTVLAEAIGKEKDWPKAEFKTLKENVLAVTFK
jgi:hypothetical protein